MSNLIESIKVLDGTVYNVKYHQERIDYSVKKIFALDQGFSLDQFFKEAILPASGLHKCRIIYGKKIVSFTIEPYVYNKVTSLKMVNADEISYDLKYEDRSALEALLKQKDDCDDILIVKNGLIADTSFSNILFYNGQEWLTPANPLLRGMQRQFLLDKGRIKEAEIRTSDFKKLTKVVLINAMNTLEDDRRILKVKIDHPF